MSRRARRPLPDLPSAVGISVAAALVLSVACGRELPEPAARHLILVTVDTLRADHVGVYGSDVETPNLDRLAADGAMALAASTHTPLTRPAHVSLFTGRLPTETGVRDNVSPARVPEVPLLAEVARDAGFRTAAFVSSVVLEGASGLARGFDVYFDDFPADPDDPGFLNSAQRPGDETLSEALGWLERERNAERLFLWLHLYDPHDPYEPPEPWRSRFSGRPYAGEVAWSDSLVGRLERRVEELGLGGETLFVVTSDHGEGLGDHDERLHGFFTYQSTLAVPLLFRGPRIEAGRRLEGPVGLVDLLPTLLELLDLSLPAGPAPTGRSLAAALAGGPEGPAPDLYAESLVPLLQFGWSDLRVLRRGRLKYIQAPRPELYDLVADPGERTNLLDRGRPAAARELRNALGTVLDAERAQGREPTATTAISGDLLQQLGALGYLGGSAPADTPTPGADPKDKIEDFRFANDHMRRGLSSLHTGDAGAAATLFAEILARGIESAELHFYLGRAEALRGRHREAARHYEETVRRTPAYAGAWTGLAAALTASGEDAEALSALDRGRRALPETASLAVEHGRLLRQMSRLAEARAALEEATRLAPNDAFSHAALAELERELGDLEAAIASFRRAVDLAPEEAEYANALAMTLGGTGRLAEAEPIFRRAVALDPTSSRYAYNLGLALERLGRPDEAKALFETALQLEPGFTPARQRLAELR